MNMRLVFLYFGGAIILIAGGLSLYSNVLKSTQPSRKAAATTAAAPSTATTQTDTAPAASAN